jgi:hypothetical protein
VCTETHPFRVHYCIIIETVSPDFLSANQPNLRVVTNDLKRDILAKKNRLLAIFLTQQNLKMGIPNGDFLIQRFYAG